MSDRRGLAFLGCGAIAARHARTLRQVAPAWRIAFASRDPARAEALARRLGGRALSGYEAALADPAVSAAFLTLPPDEHLSWTLRALDAGKDVVVEKPPFRSVAELDLAAERASQRGRRILVAENYFYKPLTRTLRELIRGGAVGDPLLLDVVAVKRQRSSGWRDGEGALFEGGIHWASFLHNIGLDPVRSEARLAGRRDGPDRSAVLVVDYAGGAVGTLHYSWEVPSPLFGLRLSHVWGREGTITFESNGVGLLVHGRRWSFRLLPGFPDLNGFAAMLRDFTAALETGCEPAMTLALARRDLAAVTANPAATGQGGKS